MKIKPVPKKHWWYDPIADRFREVWGWLDGAPIIESSMIPKNDYYILEKKKDD